MRDTRSVVWPLLLSIAVLVVLVVVAGPALVFGIAAAAGVVAAAFGFVLLLAARRQPAATRRRRAVGVPLLIGGLVLAGLAFVALVGGIDERARDWFNLD